MTSIVNNIQIEMTEGKITINGTAVSFRGTKKLFNEIVSDVANSGKWFTYALTLK